MATIDQIAEDVADSVVTEMGSFVEFPELRSAYVEVATQAALKMSSRLDKSISIDNFFEKSIDLQSKAIASAQSHNQIFVGIGYASLIAVWSATASSIPVAAMLVSGVCLVLSATVFVGWTIVGMFVNSATILKMQKVYAEGPVDFLVRNTEAEIENLQTVMKVRRWWKPVVAVAGITALIASITLIAATTGAIASKAIAAERQSSATKSASSSKVAGGVAAKR